MFFVLCVIILFYDSTAHLVRKTCSFYDVVHTTRTRAEKRVIVSYAEGASGHGHYFVL